LFEFSISCNAEACLFIYLSIKFTSTVDTLLDAYPSLLKDNNFKVCLSALKSLSLLIDRLGIGIKNHFESLISSLIERLGARKRSVRDQTIVTIMHLMKVISPQTVFDRVQSVFNHRSSFVREEILVLFRQSLDVYGPKNLSISKFLKQTICFLSDPMPLVRSAAVQCLEAMYAYVGEPLLSKLETVNVRSGQLRFIRNRLECVQLVPAHQRIELRSPNPTAVTPDYRRRPRTAKSRRNPARTPAFSPRNRSPNKQYSALHMELLRFPNMKPINIYAEQELENKMNQIAIVLKNHYTAVWKTRIDSMRLLGRLVLGGAHELDNFLPLLAQLQEPIGHQIQDLRSAVAKEACALLCLLSKTLTYSFESFADYFIPLLMKLTTVKKTVICESGNFCICTILKNTQVNRAVSTIIEGCSAKSNIIRARCMQYMSLLLKVHNHSFLERFFDDMQIKIKQSLKDKTEEVRSSARICFWSFHHHCKVKAERMIEELDSMTRKVLLENKNSSLADMMDCKAMVRGTKTRRSRSVRPTTRRRKKLMSSRRPRISSNDIPITIVTKRKRSMKSTVATPSVNKASSNGLQQQVLVARRSRIERANGSATTHQMGIAKRIIRVNEPNTERPISLRKSAVRVIPQTQYSTAPLVSIPSLLELAVSTQWSTRVKSFKRLHQKFTTSRSVEVVLFSYLFVEFVVYLKLFS